MAQWPKSLCLSQMEHAILPPTRPSPSRGSADGTTNLFGLQKTIRRIQRAKYHSPQAKIFNHWDDFSNKRNTAEQLLKQCACLNVSS